MQTKNKPLLTIFKNTILRTNLSEMDQVESILLLIHGYTGDENSMWIFRREAPANALIVSPRAPYPSSLGGYSWVDEKKPLISQQIFSQYVEAATTLKTTLDQYFSQNDIQNPPIAIVGFSQGAAMAYTLSILYPQWVKKVAALAGFIPEGCDAYITPGLMDNIEYFIAHGENDQTVTIEKAVAAYTYLNTAGAKIKYCTDQSEHKLGASCFRGLGAFLKS
jgi:phospholipase/carboxylesterase